MSDLEGNREQMDVVASGGLGSSGASVCVCARARVWIAKMQHPQLLCSPPPPFLLAHPIPSPFLDHSALCLLLFALPIQLQLTLALPPLWAAATTSAQSIQTTSAFTETAPRSA